MHSPVEELSLVILRAVETDMLRSHKVFARRGRFGNLKFELRHPVRTPSISSKITAFVADGLLPDLEPFAVAFIFLNIASRGLGHNCETGN